MASILSDHKIVLHMVPQRYPRGPSRLGRVQHRTDSLEPVNTRINLVPSILSEGFSKLVLSWHIWIPKDGVPSASSEATPHSHRCQSTPDRRWHSRMAAAALLGQENEVERLQEEVIRLKDLIAGLQHSFRRPSRREEMHPTADKRIGNVAVSICSFRPIAIRQERYSVIFLRTKGGQAGLAWGLLERVL